ncbi:hypothetical protein Mal64_36220 [Pseudobythopirellula maris]|uniref:Peptidase family M50 n=1 Tax=Pseudobythopirellula maris TaxID=2527991 RepID=A0A5C5ZHG0_9BACT|nr:hypothetical protein [Pseudobythopirellula maris]TWT86792.1 hypothetical protein Mal64_36220 [Pseudobythopirellula maris]
MLNRFRQAPRFAALAFVVLSIVWSIVVAALVTHELGHVAAAVVSGGDIASVELRPGRLPHTLLSHNPSPGFVLWAGFLSGWIAPQFTRPAWRIKRLEIGAVLRLGAGFCLLAGGVYLAAGVGLRWTDSGQLIALGWPAAILVALGAAIAAAGYAACRAPFGELAGVLRRDRSPWLLASGWLVITLTLTAGQQGIHAVVSRCLAA